MKKYIYFRVSDCMNKVNLSALFGNDPVYVSVLLSVVEMSTRNVVMSENKTSVCVITK